MTSCAHRRIMLVVTGFVRLESLLFAQSSVAISLSRVPGCKLTVQYSTRFSASLIFTSPRPVARHCLHTVSTLSIAIENH